MSFSPFDGVQGFCLDQLVGEGALEVEEGDQGLFLLLSLEELLVLCSHMLVIEGRVLAGALAPKSFQVSWVCLSFRSLYWFIWPCLNAVASSRCFFRKAWSSNSCFCLNSHESFSCCFLRVFSSFSWMIWNQRRIY